MFFPISTWLVLTALLGFASYIAIWARTGEHKPRKWSVFAFFGGSVLSALAVALCVGWSTPCIAGLTAPAGKYKIHLFLDVPGYGPRSCYIPWNVGTAEKIVEGAKDGANGSEIGLGIPGLDAGGEYQVWPLPPTPDGPPKETQ